MARPRCLVSCARGSADVEASYLQPSMQTHKLEQSMLDATDELTVRPPSGIGLSLAANGRLNQRPSLPSITRAIAGWVNRYVPRAVS